MLKQKNLHPNIGTWAKWMFLLMFQTAHSPRWRRVVSAIESPTNSLLPPNITSILKFGPDPNTLAVWHHRGSISWGRVTCTEGGMFWFLKWMICDLSVSSKIGCFYVLVYQFWMIYGGCSLIGTQWTKIIQMWMIYVITFWMFIEC